MSESALVNMIKGLIEEQHYDIYPEPIVYLAWDDPNEWLKKTHPKALDHDIIFIWSDSAYPIKNYKGIVFRTSLYKGQKNEFAFNPTDYGISSYEPIPWKEEINVGFVGCVDKNNKPRDWIVYNLLSNPDIRTDFLINRIYYGHMKSEEQECNRRRFMRTLERNPYNFCAKGAGNYSHRFYETLSAGRIPYYYNSNGGLCHEQSVDWESLMPWINDAKQIYEPLFEFHRLNRDTFEDVQRKCRFIYDEYCSLEGFAKHFKEHFR